MISNHLSSASGQCHLLQTLDVTSRSIFTAAQGSVFAEQAMFCIGEFNYYCWKDSNLVSSHRKTLDATWGQNWISQRSLPNNCLLFENCSIMYRCQRQQKQGVFSGCPTISITLILTVASFRPSIQSQNVMLDLAHGPWLSEAISSEPEHSGPLRFCSVPGTSMASEQARKMESLHNGSSWSKNLDCAKITASVILLTCTLFVIPFYIFFISNSLPLFVSLVLSHLKSSNRKISASTPTPTDQPAQPLPEAGGVQLFRILPTDGSHSNHGCPFQ